MNDDELEDQISELNEKVEDLEKIGSNKIEVLLNSIEREKTLISTLLAVFGCFVLIIGFYGLSSVDEIIGSKVDTELSEMFTDKFEFYAEKSNRTKWKNIEEENKQLQQQFSDSLSILVNEVQNHYENYKSKIEQTERQLDSLGTRTVLGRLEMMNEDIRSIILRVDQLEKTWMEETRKNEENFINLVNKDEFDEVLVLPMQEDKSSDRDYVYSTFSSILLEDYRPDHICNYKIDFSVSFYSPKDLTTTGEIKIGLHTDPLCEIPGEPDSSRIYFTRYRKKVERPTYPLRSMSFDLTPTPYSCRVDIYGTDPSPQLVIRIAPKALKRLQYLD